MMLTLKQRAALRVASLVASASIGAVFTFVFIQYFGGEAFFSTCLLVMTIYALYQVYLMQLSELEYNEKLKEITKK